MGSRLGSVSFPVCQVFVFLIHQGLEREMTQELSLSQLQLRGQEPVSQMFDGIPCFPLHLLTRKERVFWTYTEYEIA